MLDLLGYLNRVDARRGEINYKAQTILDMKLDIDEIRFWEKKKNEFIKSTLLARPPSKLPTIMQS